MKPSDHDTCAPVRDVFQTVGARWSGLVIVRLAEGPRRFSDLKRDIEGITQKSLTDTLRRLERDGLVERSVTPSIPPRVDYRLTALGHTLLEPMGVLMEWAVQHHSRVLRARERYDAEGQG